METSDQELWRRAVEGEAECFGLIFDRHGAAVQAYCRARFTDEIGESAADLVSVARLPRETSPASGQVEDPADDVARRLDDTKRLADVKGAFGRLRERDREVLLICVWGGLDYEAAAVALGVPVGTVRSRLSRARARLAELAGAGPPVTRLEAAPTGHREPSRIVASATEEKS